MDAETFKPVAQAKLDQDWQEGCDWFIQSAFTPEALERFVNVLSMDSEQFRINVRPVELAAIQNLAKLAMFEVWLRCIKRMSEFNEQ